MRSEDIEVYLSRDIIQGEEVPFYILWKGEDIQEITLELKGFKKIVEYHNLRDDFPLEERKIKIEDLKSPFYLGGILKTVESNDPFQKAYLKVVFSLLNGEKVELIQERTLFISHLKITELPDHIKSSFKNAPIKMELNGSTTVFVDMNSLENSELNIILPKEIQNAIDRFLQALTEGLKELKLKFPEYGSLIDFFIEQPPDVSERQIYEKVKKLGEVLKFNKKLVEAFEGVFIGAMLTHASFKDSFLVPLLEYFASNATSKVFFESPFQCIKVPKGGGYLKAVVIYENIITHDEDVVEAFKSIFNKKGENSKEKRENKVFLETFIESDKEVSIPIKDLIRIQRVSNDKIK